MALMTLTAAPGSPGTTTTALGLVLGWPGDALLVDADRDPSHALQAGYLRGHDLAGRGLGSVAQAHREHRSLVDDLWLQTVRFSAQDATPERRVLPGFPSPGAAGLFAPVWTALVDALQALGDSGCDVIVDAGRVGRDGLPGPLVAGSDLVLVCVRSSLRALAALRLHLPTLQAQLDAAGSGTEYGLLLVGPGRPYTRKEIEGQFDWPVLVEVAFDRRHAEVLSDGALPPRGLGQGALLRSQRTAATRLAERLRQRDDLVRMPAAAERGA